jgi:2-dehydro-3-deoxygalactonokinase
MYFATIDCGTTNSRVYIVNEKAEILGKAAKKVGVKDTAINGNNEVLKRELKNTFFTALDDANMKLSDIKFIISSGMITSEIGLLEIPHIWAPANINDLAKNIKKVQDTSIFPIDIPIYFIRGIKNKYDPQETTIKDVGRLDFMRGEETQIAGLFYIYDLGLPLTVVVLSSHTKFISIDEYKNVLGSITTVSGQVYEAIIKETFVGKSIRKDDDFDDEDYLNKEIINIAYECVKNTGFLRSLLIPRFMDTLLKTKWYDRKLFVESIIASESMKAMSQFESLNLPIETNYILIGPKRRSLIYKHLLREKIGIKKDILTINDVKDIDMLSIKGSIFLAKIAKLL